MKYKEIRAFQMKGLKTDFIVCPYCYLFSPFFTMFFVKHHVVPNVVTVLMILSGLLGAVLFAVPVIPIQILGTILIHIWFILDCSDGEVARITQKFSTFGREIDYTAHIVNHPCFTISFLIAMYLSGRYDMFWCIVAFLIFTSLESMGRHLCSFYVIRDLKLTEQKMETKNPPLLKGIILYIINSITVYPVFALLFPIIFFIDMALGTELCFFLTVLFAIANLCVIPRQVIKWVKYIVKA